MLQIQNKIRNTKTLVVLGNFDGLHLGHIAVLKTAIKKADERRLMPIVLLFDKHPCTVLSDKKNFSLIQKSERDKILQEMGFKIVTISFNDVKDLEPEDFLMHIYCKLNIRAICCGFNYHFGKDGKGDIELLKKKCESLALSLYIEDKVTYKNSPISSTRIRNALERGDVISANSMLGKEFAYELEVVDGDRQGRMLGFPTINQFFPPDFIRPKNGVYASKVYLGGRWYPAVTNIGVRPTVNGTSFRSETCILDFIGDLYGQIVRVYILDFIREEIRFSGLDKLSLAIKKDAEKARQIYHSKQRNKNHE